MNRIGIAIIVMFGFIIGGACVGYGVYAAKKPVRTVLVKGVSEKGVKADLALWQVKFVRAGDNLDVLRKEIEQDDRLVNQFLTEQKIHKNEIAFTSLNVIDKQANQYTSDQMISPRYILAKTVMLRSPDVNKIADAYQKSEHLINQGLVISNTNGGDSGAPTYLFNGLNQIKSEMIRQATQNASHAANEFAVNSNSRLGKILNADQGVFQILPRDKAPMLEEQNQIEKTVRVVSTLSYELS